MEVHSLRLRIERADETVRRVVTALMRLRAVTAQDLADEVGIPLGTLERRLRASGSSYAFTAGEVLALADYFGIEGGTLFNYMDRQYHPPHDWAPTRQQAASARSAPIRLPGEPSPDRTIDATQARLEADVAVGRAQGVLMEVDRSSGAEALTRMRAHAQRHGMSLVEVAAAVLASGRMPEVPHRT